MAVSCAADETTTDFSSDMGPSFKQKFDPSTLVEIERIKEKGLASEQVKVIIRTKNEINAYQKQKVKEAGLSIESVSGDIFTASGSYMALIRTARFDFVVYIELSKRLKQK